MLFHKNLYLDEYVTKNRRKVLKKLKQGKLQLGINVITLSKSDSDLVEIYPAYVLMQELYKEMDMMVVGVAFDRESAENLLLRMVNDCLNENGSADLKTFFS